MKKLLTIGLPLAMAVCVFIGCTSMGGGSSSSEPPGKLTITGIPAEYEGKFVSFNFNMANIAPRKIVASGRDARELFAGVESAVIRNGEAQLLLFLERPIIGGYTSYTGSDTFPVELDIWDTAQSCQGAHNGSISREPDFIFESVTFKEGIANMGWDNGFKVSSIVTVTGIPSEYNDCRITIGIGFSQSSSGLEFGAPPGGWESDGGIVVEGTVKNGAITTKIYGGGGKNGKYMRYTFTGTKDIMVLLENGKPKSTLTITGRDPSKDYFLFASTPVTDGKIALDFSRGVRK